MKTKTLLIALFALQCASLLPAQRYNAQGQRKSEGIAVGLELGWGGSPNGISVLFPARKFAFESFAGYNIKGSRNVVGTWLQKGNTMMGLSAMPILFGEYNDPAAFYLNFGANVRINNRTLAQAKEVKLAGDASSTAITPDFRSGIGLMINAGSILNLFLEVNVAYLNSAPGLYNFRQESSAGVRLILGGIH